ncbi:MAG: triple tyrosine motif-containing protein, partial [Bacteroidota bacterium]
QLLVNTYNRVLKLYTLEDHIWVELDAMVLDDVILNTYEDTHGGLWLVGTSTVFQASLTGQGIQLVAAFEVANKIFDVMNVISRQDTLTFINYEGYFYLDKEKGKVMKNEELMNKLGPPQHHFQDQQGNVWVFNGKIWYRFTEDGAITSYDYLSLFKDLRFVSFDEQSRRYWLITKGNELLNYDVHNDAEIGEAYEMFLRSVTTQTRAVDHKELFTLDYDETNLSFELSRPEYAGFLNLEYQYRLEGLQPKWSTWSTNNVIDFSFLPPGSYKLHVRTRDSFGRLEEEEVISFKVNPPYWQQPWFYSLQFLFFGGLMVVSFRLNQSNRTNQLLSEGLTVLTIVLFIEFLQSVIGSSFAVKSSPIVDFAIDAFVALLIFPLERFLRIYLTGGRISIKNRKVIKKQVIQKELKD